MNKNWYSYKNCLAYLLGLLRKHYGEGFFLSKQEEIYRDLITLCGESPATFWVSLQEQRLNYCEYGKICRKIKSYLLGREPVPYLNKKCFFFGIPIRIKKGVFIPQPDTEVLVSATLFLCRKIWPLVEKIRVLEIGCGSGNIAIALAVKKTSWNIFAVDVNKKALSLAKRNTFELGLSNIRFFFSDKFSKVTGKFNVIVSNPPYISYSEYALLDDFAKKQPREALLSADNGYSFYEKIIKEAFFFLEEKFLVAFEIGHSQEEQVVKIVLRYFSHAKVEVFKDSSGNARVIAFYQQ